MKSRLRMVLPPPEHPLPAPPADMRSFDGTWMPNRVTPLHMTKDADGKDIPLTAKARSILERRQKAVYVDHAPFLNTGTQCLPPGQPWQFGLLSPFQILQSPDSLVLAFSEYHTVWGIRLGGSGTSNAGPRQYMGQSVGRWDGDTLVVETANYKLPLWIEPDGMPASKDARITMRFRRLGGAEPQLEIATTIDDPEMFTSPWTYLRTYAWRPDMEVFEEYDCEPQALKQRNAYNLRTEGEKK